MKRSLFLIIILMPFLHEVWAQKQKPVESLQEISLQEWGQLCENTLANITVVDLWATWCSTCLERFPKMVELSEQYREHGVQFVGVNLDDPNDRGSVELAQKFLTRVGANFPQYHITDNLMLSFEQLDLLGIPAVLFLDSSGQEIARLTGDNPNNQFSDEDIEEFLNKLLDLSVE